MIGNFYPFTVVSAILATVTAIPLVNVRSTSAATEASNEQAWLTEY
jgi:hypothetical protein